MGSIMGFRPNKIITLIAIGGKERDLYKCSIKKQVLLKFIKKRNLRMKHTIKSFKFVIFFLFLQLKHVSTNLCVQSEKDIYTKKALLTFAECDDVSLSGQKAQLWFETVDNQLMLAQLLCLDVESAMAGKSYARLMKCQDSGSTQTWTWTSKVP